MACVANLDCLLLANFTLDSAQLVSKALNFLAVVVRMPGKQSLFEDQATLEAFCQRIILPNMVLRGGCRQSC